MAMSIRNDILAAWAACANDAERHAVLGQIESAKHEIRTERLWHSPSLRMAVADMDQAMTSIVMGNTSIAPVGLHRDGQPGRIAPLVGLAGWIAILLAARADEMSAQHAELRGWCVHANRMEDAIDRGGPKARPGETFTAWVAGPDPLSVACRVCGVAAGAKCIQPANGEGR